MSMTTMMDEAVNGWVLTIFGSGEKQVFVYERLLEAQEHRRRVEVEYEYNRLSAAEKLAGK